MGLFSFVRNQRAVIEWTAPDETDIVFAHPQDNPNLRFGTKLIVRDGQCAALVAKGRVADVFGPGEHVLEPNRLPRLAALLNRGSDWPSSFESAVFFVRTVPFANVPWHVSTALEPVKEAGKAEEAEVEPEAAETGVAAEAAESGATGEAETGAAGVTAESDGRLPAGGKTMLRANGVFSFRVADAGKLLAHIFDANQIYETAYLLGSLRGQIGIALAGFCREETMTDNERLAIRLENRVQASFDAMGLVLSDVRIDEWAITEETGDALVQAGGILAKTAAQEVQFADKAAHVTEAERLMLASIEQPAKRRLNS